MLIAKRLTRSTTFAVVAGLLMAVDGLAISMSRVALLDTSLTFFVLLAFLFVLRDRERTMTRIAEAVAARHDGDEPPGAQHRGGRCCGTGPGSSPPARRSAPRPRSSGRARGCWRVSASTSS